MNGRLISNYSEQEHQGTTVVIPSRPLELTNGLGLLTIFTLGKVTTTLDEGRCVARAVRSENLSDASSTDKQVPLTDAERQRLKGLLEEYADCFAENDSELGNISVEMEIKLTSNTPICYRPYRLSYYERDLVKKIIEGLLKNGTIEPTVSAYASPIILVKNKSGETRMCIDYRKLNAITEKDKYPLPRIWGPY